MTDIHLRCIASGSSGNAWLLRIYDTRLLIDAGTSAIHLQRAVEDFGGVDAILITHAHSDHIKGLDVFAKSSVAPVFATQRTAEKLPCPIQRALNVHKSTRIKDVTVLPVKVSHDADDTVAFVLSSTHFRAGFLTDLGVWTNTLASHFEDLDLLVLEANHDPTMLEKGPYPHMLKRRIAGPKGHLSNQQAQSFARQVKNRHMKHLVCAHLSETNNTQEHARAALEDAVYETCMVHVATPHGGIDIVFPTEKLRPGTEIQLGLGFTE